MRPTALCRKLTGIDNLYASDCTLQDHAVVFDVRPRWHQPRCPCCGERAPGYDRQPERTWRGESLGDTRLLLRYAPQRVECSCCGVHVEQLPWARHDSRFTADFEEKVAYLAQITHKTAVTRLLGIAWRSVGRIIESVVGERLNPDRLKGLRSIGIDEFSYRKHHRYVTLVVDHDTQRVIWAAEGKSADTLGGFFDRLDEQTLKDIQFVTMDMSASYIKAVRERLPQAQIVFDRFHVQSLVSDALEKVRRAEVRALEGEEAKTVKKTRYPLLKNPWNLTRKDRQKLADIQRNNARLYRAYLLKEAFAKALDYRQPKRACEALEEWLTWASRSKLAPFVKVARTIRKYKEGILAYIRDRYTNARVEGINNKLRVIARRAFGFHSAEALIAMLFLNCGGIELYPRLP